MFILYTRLKFTSFHFSFKSEGVLKGGAGAYIFIQIINRFSYKNNDRTIEYLQVKEWRGRKFLCKELYYLDSKLSNIDLDKKKKKNKSISYHRLFTRVILQKASVNFQVVKNDILKVIFLVVEIHCRGVPEAKNAVQPNSYSKWRDVERFEISMTRSMEFQGSSWWNSIVWYLKS